jgi:tetratricopeptide (TPR) repeat protein
VVGEQSWPLGKNGRLPHQLHLARALQKDGAPIAIVSEDELLVRLGLSDSSDGVRNRYTLAELASLLRIPWQRVRSWLLAGLIRPVAQVDGVGYFDFRDVASAKTLCDLSNAGVSTERIQRSLKQLENWLDGVEQPLEQLAILEKAGQLLVRLESGLVDSSGQMYFDFEDDEFILGIEALDAAEWFELGCQHEERGAVKEAIHAYRQSLLVGGPDADTCFNLANVLYGNGAKQEASERYWQAVELKQDYAEAWNNLGVVLGDLEHHEDAEGAFRKAIALGFADAHFNLAGVLNRVGRRIEARQHWTGFLAKSQPLGALGDYARQQLGDNRHPKGIHLGM